MEAVTALSSFQCRLVGLVMARARADVAKAMSGIIAAKYKVKRLDFPTHYLSWNIQRTPEGIHIS